MKTVLRVELKFNKFIEMGIIKKNTTTTSSKPPSSSSQDNAAGVVGNSCASTHFLSNNLSAHGMINPLSEDASEVHQNLLNQKQAKGAKNKIFSSSSHRPPSATTVRCGLGSWLANKSGGTSEHWGHVTVVNVVFYILCVAAIGCSVYLNYRQSFLEERLRYMHHLDERLTHVEARLESVFQQLPLAPAQLRQPRGVHHRRRVSPAINGFFSTTEKEFHASSTLALSGSEEVDSDESVEFEDMKSVVRKLSLEVQGMQRLRRDVSHLKLTRQQRQTAIEQSPEDICSCPPGECSVPLWNE